MIPKILWHIWISDKPEPEQFKKYTDTWVKVMPDYEIRYVTLGSVIGLNDVVDLYIKEKKWSVLNHYIRYLFLYMYGGIYLDLDVEVIQSFNDLLYRDLIIGREDEKCINNAIMGCKSDNWLMKKCLEDIMNISITDDQIELKTGPWLVTEIFKKSHSDFQRQVLPAPYFYPYHYSEKFTLECIKPETHAIHHWNASWQKNDINNYSIL